MKKNLYAAAVFSLLVGGLAHADEAKPDNELSFNAAATSDYRFRGISQSRLQSAVQGGIDYLNNPTGLYVGTWLSTIKWTKDDGGSGSIEWDVYAGQRGQISADVSYDIGAVSYIYPSNSLSSVPGLVNANTTELYGQISYGPAYLKYSQSVTNLFGFVESKNSDYLDAGANFDLGNGNTLNLHAGHQQIKNASTANYSDWKIGVTRDFEVVSVALAAIGTNAEKTAYASPANGKFLGKSALVFSVSKMF